MPSRYSVCMSCGLVHGAHIIVPRVAVPYRKRGRHDGNVVGVHASNSRIQGRWLIPDQSPDGLCVTSASMWSGLGGVRGPSVGLSEGPGRILCVPRDVWGGIPVDGDAFLDGLHLASPEQWCRIARTERTFHQVSTTNAGTTGSKPTSKIWPVSPFEHDAGRVKWANAGLNFSLSSATKTHRVCGSIHPRRRSCRAAG